MRIEIKVGNISSNKRVVFPFEKLDNIDKNGDKWNEYVTTKSSRKTKVKALITQKYKIDIEQCKDFGLREVTE